MVAGHSVRSLPLPNQTLRRRWLPGPEFRASVSASLSQVDVEIVKRSDRAKGFVVLPKRWVVERTLAWLNRCRRLSKDREKSVLSSGSFIKLAMIQLMLHRLRPSDAEPEFHYREAG